jgi:hypothetical protein
MVRGLKAGAASVMFSCLLVATAGCANPRTPATARAPGAPQQRAKTYHPASIARPDDVALARGLNEGPPGPPCGAPGPSVTVTSASCCSRVRDAELKYASFDLNISNPSPNAVWVVLDYFGGIPAKVGRTVLWALPPPGHAHIWEFRGSDDMKAVRIAAKAKVSLEDVQRTFVGEAITARFAIASDVAVAGVRATSWVADEGLTYSGTFRVSDRRDYPVAGVNGAPARERDTGDDLKVVEVQTLCVQSVPLVEN